MVWAIAVPERAMAVERAIAEAMVLMCILIAFYNVSMNEHLLAYETPVLDNRCGRTRQIGTGCFGAGLAARPGKGHHFHAAARRQNAACHALSGWLCQDPPAEHAFCGA